MKEEKDFDWVEAILLLIFICVAIFCMNKFEHRFDNAADFECVASGYNESTDWDFKGKYDFGLECDGQIIGKDCWVVKTCVEDDKWGNCIDKEKRIFC